MSPAALTELPLELLLLVFAQLDGRDLVALARSCRKFKAVVLDGDGGSADAAVWRLAARTTYGVTECMPYPTFFSLYAGLYQFRYLSAGLWMGDAAQFGSLLLSRYDPQTGSLALFKLGSSVAVHGATQPFGENPLVTISEREMVITPIFYAEYNSGTEYITSKGIWKYSAPNRLAVGLLRVAPLDPKRLWPGMKVWPPFKVPAPDRTRNVSLNNFDGHYIPSRQTASPNLFRFRLLPNFHLPNPTETFAKIGEDLLTPTRAYPWRGIWMANYISGVEFILILQPSQSRLEAIKLTGR